MREWCSCGGGINALSRQQVKKWRNHHLHGEGPQGSTSQVELSRQDEEARDRIGFRPNN